MTVRPLFLCCRAGSYFGRGLKKMVPHKQFLFSRPEAAFTKCGHTSPQWAQCAYYPSMAYHADSSELDQKEILTWEGFGTAQRELAQQIADSGFNPDIIIAVARGGLLPAGALSYSLGVKLSDAINVEFYTDVQETLPDPVLLEPLLDTDSISNKKLLVVDDVADSGRTLHLVLNLLKQHGAEVRSAVLYGKSRSEIAPDYVWKHTDEWIVFPWSAEPPVNYEG